MEDFTPPHLQALKENGIQAVVLMEKPYQIILMPLKEFEDEERLKSLGYQQLPITDPELERMANRQGLFKAITVRLANEFKMDLK